MRPSTDSIPAARPVASGGKHTRIAMVAGEASSDLLGSHLLAALGDRLPAPVHSYGIGGPLMQQQGFEAMWPAELLSVYGYVDAIKRYRELSAIRRSLCTQLLGERKPDVLIGVDAPDFNLWLEGRLKAAGIPAVHFVSPSIWAWRGGRIKTISRSVSHVLCLFPFEPALYAKAGVAATFVGHPTADVLPVATDQTAARKRLGIINASPVIAVLPGSRQSEVRSLAADYIGAMHILHQRHSQVQFIVPLATPETQALFHAALARQDAPQSLNVTVLAGGAVDAMTAADVVLVASGTASLEAALLKRPMVICYRVGRWQYRLFKKMAYLPWVGLPNILMNQSVVPELLQDAVNPQQIADALDHWLSHPAQCQQLVRRFTDLHLELRQNTAQKAAEVIQAYLP